MADRRRGSSVVGRSDRHRHNYYHHHSSLFRSIAVLYFGVVSLQNRMGGCRGYTAAPIFFLGHRRPNGADGGGGRGTTVQHFPRSPRSGTVAASSTDPSEDLDNNGPEISLMPGYVADFLRKTNQTEQTESAAVSPSIATGFDESNGDTMGNNGVTKEDKEEADLVSGNDSTDRAVASLAPSIEEAAVDDNNANGEYLIAIPLDECHELGLELESVQRAILYHCPVLVHACIPLAATRLPLLYVAVAAAATKTTPSSDKILQQLRTIVASTVREVLHENNNDEEQGGKASDSGATSNASLDDNPMDRIQRDDGRPDVGGINDDGLRPLVIPFGTLEIDGAGNQVLCTVGVPNARGTRTLAKFVDRLRHNLEAPGAGEVGGFLTQLPDDPQSQSGSSEAPSSFRPRIPFVRLPPNWEDYLPQSSNTGEEEDFFLTSDQGGNGISPILWGQWMDDTFGEPARMREIGIYQRRRRRQQPGMVASTDSDVQPASFDECNEAAFPWPVASVPLPQGNAALTQAERHFEMYQKRRVEEAHEREQRLAQGGNQEDWEKPPAVKDGGRPDESPVFQKTLNRLQAPYQLDAPPADVTLSQSKANVVAPGSELPRTQMGSAINSRDDDDDSWMRERIRKVIDARERVQSELRLTDPKRRLDKVPLEDNPVFAKYKNGTLVPNAVVPPAVTARTLPPFPSREYCVGFWRVVSSPTGFAVEEGDASRSDNLILRVDGTTAGGPILDQETRQKASAGTWKLSAADADESAHLRIRLVIPPRKDRILVLQGSLERVAPSSSSTGEWALAPRGTFGIPELEERAARATADVEELLYCSGTVSIEDAVTGLNREDIGTFSLQKLNTPTEPSQFTITIPRNVRNQD